ncbi:nucleotidyl transferase AbiEii/AbiGii toxin family protein [Streptosporangium sp. NPDC049376]|uniref:nucleotidyl transferase AbiEii/AbiGii toxin family protein n=1 Tax=Streptosporangium sp. NPDC049376 TaxID=3366192 RepID=UPI0037927B06
MAGRGDVNSQTPGGLPSEDDFGGVSATDVRPVWETEQLPDWVVHWLIPMLMSGQAWPEASESGLWKLREVHRRAVEVYAAAFEPTSTAVRTIAADWEAPVKPVTFSRIGQMYDEKTGVLSKMAGHHRYAQQTDAFALETQYSKISINVAFWVAVIAIAIALLAAFFSAGTTTPMVGSTATALREVIRKILTRLGIMAARPAGVAAASKLTTLAGGAGGKLLSGALARELFEEIGEETFIDAYTQYKQIQLGTRKSWDWNKTMAAVIGAGAGAVVGTKIGGSVSGLTNRLPGIRQLNRSAGDLPGWGNAFKRFPGRALNTGLNNVVASPAGSFVANGLVYGQWAPPTADSLVGGFMGGAGRTNTVSPFNADVVGAFVNPAGALNSAIDAAAATDLASVGTDPSSGGAPGNDSGGGPGTGPGTGPGSGPGNGPGSGSHSSQGPVQGPISPTTPKSSSTPTTPPGTHASPGTAPHVSPGTKTSSTTHVSPTTHTAPDAASDTAPDTQVSPDTQVAPDTQQTGAQQTGAQPTGGVPQAGGTQGNGATTAEQQGRPDQAAAPDVTDPTSTTQSPTSQNPANPQSQQSPASTGHQGTAAVNPADMTAPATSTAPEGPAGPSSGGQGNTALAGPTPSASAPVADQQGDPVPGGTPARTAPDGTPGAAVPLVGSRGGIRPAGSIDALINRGRPAPPEEIDHGVRVPKLNVEPASGPEQTLANAHDPREVPSARDWEGLRGSVAPEPVTVPHASGAVRLEARRLSVPWRGQRRPVTEITVRVSVRADPRMSPEEIAAAYARVLEGVDLYCNHQHRLPDGSQLHVRMEFVVAPDSAPTGEVVHLHPGTGVRAFDFADLQSWSGEGEVITAPLDQLADYRSRAPIDHTSWYAEMPPVVFAHETMHLLGMLDEYVDARDGNRADLGAAGVRGDANLLGHTVLLWSGGNPVLDRDGHPVPEAVGLRDRHLEHVYGLLPESGAFTARPETAPATSGPANSTSSTAENSEPEASTSENLAPENSTTDNPETRPGPEAETRNETRPETQDETQDETRPETQDETRPEEWSRPDYEPGRLPGNLRTLLEEFPAGDRPLLEHLRLLERADALFADEGPLTPYHLAYTDALVRMAQEVYDTGPEYSFSTTELARLRGLSELLLGDAPPRLDALAEQVNELLGRDRDTTVENRKIHTLAGIVADVTPRPGETGRQTARRAVLERRGSLSGVLELRRAGIRIPQVATDPALAMRSALSPDDSRGADSGSDSDPRVFQRFWNTLMNQVRAEAHRRGTGVLDELQQFTLQRALGRIFTANPDDWMLKGGQAMLSRNPGGRASSDIDLVRISGDTDPEVMAAEYEAALARDHGDMLRFERVSKVPILHGKAVRMVHRVYCGDMEIMQLSVDIAPPRTRPVWKEPDLIAFPPQIMSTGHPDEAPAIRVISYEDTLAHKVSGIYTHGIRTLETRCLDCTARGGGLFSCKSGDLPYRCQDLVDVLMIILSSSWDGPATHAMLHAEFAWRLEQGENMKVPESFEIPNPDWFRKFDQYARTTPGLPYGGLAEAIPVAQAFLDPLLRPEAPPASRWDPQTRQWVETDGTTPAPMTDAGESTAPTGTPRVRQLEGPSVAPASTVHADPDMVERWDHLTRGGLDEELRLLKERTDLSPEEKAEFVKGRLMYDNGYTELTRVPGPENENYKHLRFYAHQRGELYSHAAALMADPETTVEIAFEPDRGFKTYQWDSHQTHLAFLGDLPAGLTADQANAAFLRALLKTPDVTDLDPATLADHFVDLHAQPLKDALELRRRLIEDYGIEPHRVRLAFANTSQKSHYAETQWMRAQLLTLQAIQTDAEQARRRMVDRMLGPDEESAARRTARAQAVVDRLGAANGNPEEYALLWVRDTRGQPVGGRHGPHLDTRPEILRQTIETLRERHPGRRVVLLGDDVFAGRPGLEEAWRREGVLDGVDIRTLVEFWKPEHNEGVALNYAEQGLFFARLAAQHDVVQIGMESGALEIPAMLGVPTVYFEALEHDGNKGNRWLLYWQDWTFGRPEQVLDDQGNPLFDRMGRPVTRFVVEETSPAPLTGMRRVSFGPDLSDPTNRRGQPVAVYHSARLAVTVDRIARLVSSGQLDQWPLRLGRSSSLDGKEWIDWTAEDWRRSAYYADQLRLWLGTDATTPDEVGRKWHGVRLALLGVLEPQFIADQEYEGLSLAHPYAVLSLETSPANTSANTETDPAAARIAQAYDTAQEERGVAVTEALRPLLASPDLARRALEELRLFQLTPAELLTLGEEIDRATGNAVRPYAERLEIPIAEGQPTPREVLERFDPTVAGLPEVTPEEAARYIADNVATRPWLAGVADLDPAVQRVLVAVDQGQGHHLARHEGFAADGRLERRVTWLEDPAQLDEGERARSTDAFKPGDREHGCADAATAISDPVAFAVAVARSIEHPAVRNALTTPFDPDRRPDRVTVPIEELLGPDGHLYFSGYRIVPLNGSLEAAISNRASWVMERRDPANLPEDRRPTGPEPQAVPIASMEGGSMQYFFQPNRQGDGYEITTMFADPA